MAKHLLTDRQIQNARPKAKPYRLADGDGLYLYVPLSDASSWQFRYRLGDKPQTATLGRLDRITLGQARAKAQEVRTLVADGHHVTAVRRVERAKRAAARTATFGALAADWLKRDARRAKWTDDYRHEVKASLDNHLSALVTLPVAEITTAIAAKPIRKVEDSAPDMALKVRQRLRAIMDYAVEQGLIPLNPIPAPRRGKRARMKRKDAQRGPHVVPLPPHLLALLLEWRRTDGDAAIYASPAPHGAGAITREAVEKFYRRTLELTGRHSPHSWRSVFSTWARDAGKDADVIEAQLDHTIGTKQAAAYDRAKRLEIRRELMMWYEGQLLAARDGATVMPLRKAAPAS